MKGWKEVNIKSISSRITSGGTPSTKCPEYYGGNIPWLNTKEVNFRVIESTENYITELGLGNSSAKWIEANSIIVAMYGATAGKCALTKIPLTTNQACCNITIDQKIADYKYIYYTLVDSYSELENMATGAAQQNLNAGMIAEFSLLLPPLPEQKAIAAVLSSLDDKIDLLHRQNKTLEAMAETLFRQWFVEEADEGWEEVALGDLVESINGVSYKGSELNPSDCALVSLKSFDRNGGFRLDGFKEYTGNYKKNQIVTQGDIAVAHTDITQDAAVIGNPVYIISDPRFKTMVVSMDLVKVEPKNEWLSKEFIYFLLRTKDFKQHCLGFSNGSTVLHLSKNAIPQYTFLIPPKQTIILFSKTVQPLFMKQIENIIQIRTLEKLRDTLLPKLMNGEIRVKV
jgi:type I restriction enzyme S subunit